MGVSIIIIIHYVTAKHAHSRYEYRFIDSSITINVHYYATL